jgi:hypothetical protein
MTHGAIVILFTTNRKGDDGINVIVIVFFAMRKKNKDNETHTTHCLSS